MLRRGKLALLRLFGGVWELAGCFVPRSGRNVLVPRM
jgi:hypothetical protein